MADDTTSSTAPKPRKPATRKPSTRKAPAKAPAAKKAPARRTSRSANKADHHVRNRTIAALGVVGAVAAGVGWAVSFGLIDKLFGAKNAEHPVPDLAPGVDVRATRAVDAFRPDPTASVPESEREGLRPATGPAPSLAATRGEMANQTTPALGDA